MHLFRAIQGRLTAAALVVLGAATAVAPARAQDLYVANQTNSTIEKFASSGGSLSSTGTPFTTDGLHGPLGLAFDSAGNLYAADYGTGSTNGDTIVEYESVGGVLTSTATQINHNTLASPLNMAFDSAGNLFVTYRGSGSNGNEIVEYLLTGGRVAGSGTVFTTTGSDRPDGLAFDTAGNLYVSFEGSRNYIEKYASIGGVLSPAGTEFSSDSSVDPAGLAFDKAGSLYAASYVNNTIEKYAFAEGTLSNTGTVFASTGLNGPRGLAFDAAGNLYVSNLNAGLVIYTSTDGVLSNSGIKITDPGLQEPGGLAFSPSPAPPARPIPKASNMLPWMIFGTMCFSAIGGLYIAKRFAGLKQA